MSPIRSRETTPPAVSENGGESRSIACVGTRSPTVFSLLVESPPSSPTTKEYTPETLAITVHPASETSSASGDRTPPSTSPIVDLTIPKSNADSRPNYVPVESDPDFTEGPGPSNTPDHRRSVRFRSRVRITSGFHRHSRTTRHSRLDPDSLLSPDTDYHGPSEQPYFHSRNSSSSHSDSSSPSSSISAPLKYRRDSASTYDPDEESGWRGRTIGWKPLGQRINFLPRSAPNEQSSLIRHGTSSRRYGVEEEDENVEDDYAEQIAREIDLVFGTWPGRLLNRHVGFVLTVFQKDHLFMLLQWWWWQLEPALCCLCLDDFDE